MKKEDRDTNDIGVIFFTPDTLVALSSIIDGIPTLDKDDDDDVKLSLVDRNRHILCGMSSSDVIINGSLRSFSIFWNSPELRLTEQNFSRFIP